MLASFVFTASGDGLHFDHFGELSEFQQNIQCAGDTDGQFDPWPSGGLEAGRCDVHAIVTRRHLRNQILPG